MFAADFAWASPCCGGSFSLPSLVAGDEKAQLTTSIVRNEIVSDVYPDGHWRDRGFRETMETLKIEGAHILRDRWQAGGSMPLIRRSRGEASSTGLGDAVATLGYEYLPDWDYNPWRPKGLGYLQLTLPTGKPVQQAESPYQLDSRGRGFWSLGVGTLLSKTFLEWDAYASLAIHRSLARKYSNEQGSGTLTPGWGARWGVGVGYNIADFRVGASLLWTYEDPVSVSGTQSSPGAVERLATASLSASYLIQEDWSAMLSYSDDTKFGNPVNARLGRALSFQLQRRWSR